MLIQSYKVGSVYLEVLVFKGEIHWQGGTVMVSTVLYAEMIWHLICHASLALKQFVDTIVLFSGDCDFVPAAKLARREGVDFILDPMNANVDPQLFEHIDGMHNAFPHIKRLGRSVKKNK